MSTIFYLVSHKSKCYVELGKFGTIWDENVPAFREFLLETAMCGPYELADDTGSVFDLDEAGYQRIKATIDDDDDTWAIA